jgi:dTDP-4-dehydrorhamnose 3,5-epimerase
MNIVEKKIKGVFEITLSPQTDDRGFFMRSYDLKIFEYFGIHREWVQENHSRTEKRGVIRGLHFQMPPFDETKLIRCTRGSILDVYVDLRKKSNTYGKWDAVELTEQSRKMLFLPKGFAHGFCSLTELSEVMYKVDNYYNKDYEYGILWNDKDLNINWPVEEPLLSEKDKKLLTFAEFTKKSMNPEDELCI